MTKNVALVLLMFCFLKASEAQYNISGKVFNENKKPLHGVSVSAGDSISPGVTDSAGNYSFRFNSAPTSLSFSYVGYVPLTILLKDLPAVVTLYPGNELLPATLVRSFEKNSTLLNVPAAVTVLSKPDLERYGSESLVPAVNTVPGVKMDERSPGSYRLSIRGNILRSTFGVRNVKVYWNGIPFTDANGTTNINELALSNIDRIEILKGPSGSMYGSGTGGVVLLENDLTSVKTKNITARISGGSYGMFSSAVTFNHSDQKAGISVSLSHGQSDGYRQQSAMRRDAANFTGTFSRGTRNKLHTNIFYSDLYYETPGGLTMAELTKDPKQARPAAGSFQSATAQHAAIYLKTIYAGFAVETMLNERWRNTISVYGSNTDFKNPTIRNYEKNMQQGIGLRDVTQYKRGSFTVTAGGEYQYGITRSGTYGNRFGVADSLQFRDKTGSRQFNIFLQGDLSIAENFILNAGLSYNNFHLGYVRTSVTPFNKLNSDFRPALVPRVSVLKKIRKDLSIYAAASKGFSPPSIDEVRGGNDMFNGNLNAETAVNYEAGIKGYIIKNKLWIDGSVYYFTLRNTIVSRRDSAGGTIISMPGKRASMASKWQQDILP